MQLQKLGTERMQEIIEFDHLCFPNDFWKEEDWESLLRDERAIYYALLDDGRIVGDLFLYNWQGEQDYVKLMHISVHPDYRKQGLGERLMTHAQQEMKELGMGRFRGETRASNLPMQRLFEKKGLPAGSGRGKLLPQSRGKRIQVSPAILSRSKKG